jgi:hypothetical protein
MLYFGVGVKLQFLGNNLKTVNKNRILTWGKNDQHSKIYLPCNFEVNLITRIGVISLQTDAGRVRWAKNEFTGHLYIIWKASFKPCFL